MKTNERVSFRQNRFSQRPGLVWFFWALTCLATTPAYCAVILQYHHIDVDTPTSTSTTPEQFLQHLELIESEGFSVVPLTDLVDKLKTKDSDTAAESVTLDKQVAITFDDGYRSVFTEAYPLLKQRQWPFTIFVNTAPIDEQSAVHVSWDQLREMIAHGATVANHSVSHDHLVQRLKGETSNQWRDRTSADILTAERRILEETGQSVQLLAYPYGEYDAALKTLLKPLGFMAFGQHSGPVSATLSTLAIPRFPFGGHYGSPDDFRTKINTLTFPIDKIHLRGPSGTLEDGVVSTGDELQSIDLILRAEVSLVRCFGPVELSVGQTRQGVRIEIKDKIPIGRSRINCTSRHSSGRYLWFSQPLFRPNREGVWPE